MSAQRPALVWHCFKGAVRETKQGSGSEQGSAENYPRGPVELVAPYSEGGGTDLNARAISANYRVGIRCSPCL